MMSSSIPPDVDGGKAWLPVLGLFLATMMYGAATRSFGVLYVAIRKMFGASDTDTSVVGALNMFIIGISAPLTSWMVSKCGHRLVAVFGALFSILGFGVSAFAPNIPFLDVTYGLILGFGISFAQFPGYLAVNRNFIERQSLAVALGGMGTNLGNFIFPPLMTYMLQTINFQGCLLVLALLSAILFANGILYRLPGEPILGNSSCHSIKTIVERGQDEASAEPPILPTKGFEEDETLTQDPSYADDYSVSLPDPSYVDDRNVSISYRIIRYFSLLSDIVTVSFLFVSFSANMMNSFLTEYIVAADETMGLNELQGSFVLAISGIGGLVFSVLVGFAMDLKWIRKYRIDVVNFNVFIGAVLLLVTPYIPDYSGQMALSFFRGGTDSVMTSQRVNVAQVIVGAERTADLYGMALATDAFGSLTGRVVGGLFYDNVGSYTGSFVMLAVFTIFSNVFLQATLTIRRNGFLKYDTLT